MVSAVFSVPFKQAVTHRLPMRNLIYVNIMYVRAALVRQDADTDRSINIISGVRFIIKDALYDYVDRGSISLR